MRLPAVLDTDHLPLAEQCAVRLDGDGFALGNALIAADEPAAPPQRAGSLAGATRRHDLVLGGWTAAWVHGATDALRRPIDVQIERERGVRAGPTPLREVVLGARDVVRIGGVRVTTPFRTAADLARLEPALPSETAAVLRALVARSGLTWPQAVAALAGLPSAFGKRRALARFRAFRDEVPEGGGDRGAAWPQPAETR